MNTHTNDDFSIGSAIIRNPKGLTEATSEATPPQRDTPSTDLQSIIKTLKAYNPRVAVQAFSKVDGWQTLEVFASYNSAIARRHEIERIQPLYKGITRIKFLP